jgi:ubiquinone biosynthesis O-methyltransferase
MGNKSYELSAIQKFSMLFRLLGKSQVPYKRNFLKYHLIRRKYILSRTSEFFGKNKFEPAPLLNRRILDVGCGLNGISDELAFRGGDILAIDRNLEVLTSAKNNALHNGSPVDYQNRTLENLHTDEKFDVILLLDFLHKRNVEKSLDKVQELLKEDGVIVISGSNKTLKSYIRNIFVPKFLLKMMHLNVKSTDLMKLKRVKNGLQGHGFSILGTQGIDFNFFTGKWHKTKSTRVRYIMYASKVDKDYHSKIEE